MSLGTDDWLVAKWSVPPAVGTGVGSLQWSEGACNRLTWRGSIRHAYASEFRVVAVEQVRSAETCRQGWSDGASVRRAGSSAFSIDDAPRAGGVGA